MGCGASADKSQACPQQGGATLLADAAKAPAPEKAACDVGAEVAESARNAGDVATAKVPEQSSGGDIATAPAPEKTACEGGAELAPEQPAGLTACEGVAEPPLEQSAGGAGDAEIEVPPQQSSGGGNATSELAPNQSADVSLAVGRKEDEKQQAESTNEDEKRLTLANETPAGAPVAVKAVEAPATAEIQNEAIPLHEQLPEASMTTETGNKQEEASANESTAEVKEAAESGVEEAGAVFESLPEAPEATKEAISGEQQPAEALSEKFLEVPAATEEAVSGEQELAEAVSEKPAEPSAVEEAISGEQQPVEILSEKLPEVPAATEEAVLGEQEPADAVSEKPLAEPTETKEAVSGEQQPAEA